MHGGTPPVLLRAWAALAAPMPGFCKFKPCTPARQPPPHPRGQVPVIQVMLGQLGLVSSDMMFSQWRYVVVGATVAAAVLTPSTDPFTQTLLAVPLVGLYMGGAYAVKVGGPRASQGGEGQRVHARLLLLRRGQVCGTPGQGRICGGVLPQSGAQISTHSIVGGAPTPSIVFATGGLQGERGSIMQGGPAAHAHCLSRAHSTIALPLQVLESRRAAQQA